MTYTATVTRLNAVTNRMQTSTHKVPAQDVNAAAEQLASLFAGKEIGIHIEGHGHVSHCQDSGI